MASYHCQVHPNVSRGRGQSIVATAAYNARSRLVDERTGEVWDYRHLGAALWSGTYAPKGAPEFVADLQRLVNEVERAEKRSDAQLAMNLDIALPHELTLEQNQRLGQDFVREQFMRPGYVARMDIHAPDPKGDERNIHMHVWVTLRKIDGNGFARTKGEQQERYRNRAEYVEELRERWERLGNRHLERHGHAPTLDRRSLQERGIDREPEQHRGPTVTKMERERGEVSHIADAIRRRQNQYAELRALKAEERQIDAEIIDLQARRAEREARAAAKGRVEQILPWSGREVAGKDDGRYSDIDDLEKKRAEHDAQAEWEARQRSDAGPSRKVEQEKSSSRTEPPRARKREGSGLRRRSPNHYAELRAAQAPQPPPKVRPEFAREAVQAWKTAEAPTLPGQATGRTTQARSATPAADMRRAGAAAKGGRAAEKTAGKAGGIIGRGILGVFALFLQLFDLFPAKPPSPEQQKRNRQAAKEQQATDAIAAGKEVIAERQAREQNSRQQERARQRRERGRDDDGGRERER